MKVLLIGRSGAQTAAVAQMLKARNALVDRIATLSVAEEFLALRHYDILLLDLEEVDSETRLALEQMRQRWPEPRLVVMASEISPGALSKLLKVSADDFILKPVKLVELEARIRLSLRAVSQPLKSALSAGPVKIDLVTQDVWLAGESIELTARERSVLNVLVSHCGSIVSKDFIASRIFSIDDETAIEIIEVYVHRLRKKIAHPDCGIRTVRGQGYAFEVRKT